MHREKGSPASFETVEYGCCFNKMLGISIFTIIAYV